MASTYTRQDSPFVLIRFKDEAGKWRNQRTGYRKDNLGDVRQAKLLARRMSVDEKTRRTAKGGGETFDSWVIRWFETTYGTRQNKTLDSYLRRWRETSRWLSDHQITTPVQLRYQHLVDYRDDRIEEGAGLNTVIMEVKVLRLVMQEAVRREMIETNPCASLGWKRVAPKEKSPWTDDEFRRVRDALQARDPHGWMLVTLLLGFYQAARLGQCEVPLASINLETQRISYWRTIDDRPLTKGDKPFTQPLDPRLVPMLRPIIESRRAAGEKALCTLPEIPSVHWRSFLDSLGLTHLCHHGLRVTWITRAAASGKIPEPQARRFVNHGKGAVHHIYQKLSADDVAHVPAALDLPE